MRGENITSPGRGDPYFSTRLVDIARLPKNLEWWWYDSRVSAGYRQLEANIEICLWQVVTTWYDSVNVGELREL